MVLRGGWWNIGELCDLPCFFQQPRLEAGPQVQRLLHLSIIVTARGQTGDVRSDGADSPEKAEDRARRTAGGRATAFHHGRLFPGIITVVCCMSGFFFSSEV